MARLTILQASQQGFGSTLTIHRHIKDGTLPVYEDGDTKLLEVNDLIAVFGEPKRGFFQEESASPAPANGRVDIHEYHRLKAELEQQQKKNMWLSADLAEAVRAVREKEAKFDKERERLLTVLEQAQALLLRAEGQIGPIKAAAGEPKQDAASEAAAVDAAVAAAAASDEKVPEDTAPEMQSAAVHDDPAEAAPEKADNNDLSGIETIEGAASDAGDRDADAIIASKMTSEQEKLFAPFNESTDENASEAPSEKKAVKENQNPLIPPLEDPSAKSGGGGRALGAMTWLLLFALAGGGFVFYEYRTKVLMSVSKVIQALS